MRGSDGTRGSGSLVAANFPAWLGRRLNVLDLALHSVIHHAEGFSWQTYTLEAEWRDASGAVHSRGFAIRVQPRDGLLALYDIEAQYRPHEAVCRHAAIPSPAPLWLEMSPDILGMPFYVMERAEGHVPVQWRSDDPVAFPTPAVRRKIGLEFVDVQAEIHSIDWRANGLSSLAATATRSVRPTPSLIAGSTAMNARSSSNCPSFGRRSAGCGPTSSPRTDSSCVMGITGSATLWCAMGGWSRCSAGSSPISETPSRIWPIRGCRSRGAAIQSCRGVAAPGIS